MPRIKNRKCPKTFEPGACVAIGKILSRLSFVSSRYAMKFAGSSFVCLRGNEEKKKRKKKEKTKENSISSDTKYASISIRKRETPRILPTAENVKTFTVI